MSIHSRHTIFPERKMTGKEALSAHVSPKYKHHLKVTIAAEASLKRITEERNKKLSRSGLYNKDNDKSTLVVRKISEMTPEERKEFGV